MCFCDSSDTLKLLQKIMKNIFSIFFLVLMLVDYQLYDTDLKNKILWFFENQPNWFMSSLIPSSKSGMINMISQNNYNQIIEITPSCSAYHSKFVTIVLVKNW